MSIHAGHRQRLKERFCAEGLDNFSDVQVLELLLFYAIPRQDTNPIAHQLLAHFGSLSQVLDAPVEELEKVPGVGHNAATFLALVTAVGRYYLVNRNEKNRILTSIQACGDFLMPHFYGIRNEKVMLLCLDAKCKVLCCREVGEGSVNSAGISVRKIVEVALAVNATSVVLAHNHPSGIALPSDEDKKTTERIATALEMVDVILADHIVVADDDYVSMVHSGLYRPDVNRIC